MRVRMLVQVTGTRNGAAWPAPGEEIDLPKHEAEKLVAAGHAERTVEPKKSARRKAA